MPLELNEVFVAIKKNQPLVAPKLEQPFFTYADVQQILFLTIEIESLNVSGNSGSGSK